MKQDVDTKVLRDPTWSESLNARTFHGTPGRSKRRQKRGTQAKQLRRRWIVYHPSAHRSLDVAGELLTSKSELWTVLRQRTGSPTE